MGSGGENEGNVAHGSRKKKLKIISESHIGRVGTGKWGDDDSRAHVSGAVATATV